MKVTLVDSELGTAVDLTETQTAFLIRAVNSFYFSERARTKKALERKRNPWRPSEAAIHMATVSEFWRVTMSIVKPEALKREDADNETRG